jgi:lipoprotein-releasing system ATP-binding protein
MPGYMHIRFESELLVSLRAEPEEDIKARKDRYYVYLKRTDASDQEIKEKMNYQSDPPLFIPMPPH